MSISKEYKWIENIKTFILKLSIFTIIPRAPHLKKEWCLNFCNGFYIYTLIKIKGLNINSDNKHKVSIALFFFIKSRRRGNACPLSRCDGPRICEGVREDFGYRDTSGPNERWTHKTQPLPLQIAFSVRLSVKKLSHRVLFSLYFFTYSMFLNELFQWFHPLSSSSNCIHAC